MIRRRAVLRTLAVGTVGASAGCLSHPLPALRGTVTRKRVVSADETLLAASSDRVAVRDSGLRKSLRGRERGNVSVTGKAVRELSARHASIDYRVTVRHENANYVDGVEPGDSESYHASRGTFNRVMAGDDLRFQVGLVDRPNLLNPGRVVRSGRVAEKSLVGLKQSAESDGSGLFGVLGSGDGDVAVTETRLTTVTEDASNANRTILDGKRRVGAGVARTLTDSEFDGLVYRASVNHGDGRRRTYEFGSKSETGRAVFNRARVGERATFEVEGEYGHRLVAFVE